MHYVIQENMFREEGHRRLLRFLDNSGLTYDVVRLFPFVDKIVDINKCPPESVPFDVEDLSEYVAPAGAVWPFGAVKMAHIASRNGWMPGSMYNENHDFQVYGTKYGDLMLNSDSIVAPMLTVASIWGDRDKELFLRPTGDTKAFSGGLFDTERWTNTVGMLLDRPGDHDIMVQMAKPKVVWEEARFWVVGHDVVTMSTYMRDGKLVERDLAWPELVRPDLLTTAMDAVETYRPSEAFVIDVALTENGPKVVEVNCINCSGFYGCDLERIVHALEHHF